MSEHKDDMPIPDSIPEGKISTGDDFPVRVTGLPWRPIAEAKTDGTRYLVYWKLATAWPDLGSGPIYAMAFSDGERWFSPDGEVCRPTHFVELHPPRE